MAVNDLHGLILEDHNRLRELMRSAVESPDEHALQSLVRAVMIHEAVEGEMLEEAAPQPDTDAGRCCLRAQAEHQRLIAIVMDMLEGGLTGERLQTLERAFLAHIDHEERV